MCWGKYLIDFKTIIKRSASRILMNELYWVAMINYILDKTVVNIACFCGILFAIFATDICLMSWYCFYQKTLLHLNEGISLYLFSLHLHCIWPLQLTIPRAKLCQSKNFTILKHFVQTSEVWIIFSLLN